MDLEVLYGSLCRWRDGPKPQVELFWKRATTKTGNVSGTLVINQQGAADLMAVGPSRHRAWVVSQRPLECSLGSRSRSLGGLMAAL